MLCPLTFRPILKERVWGGRELERLYGKALPVGVPIGESWEISDRPGGASVIANGPLAGKDLRWLMERHEAELLGSAPSQHGRFPLLVKILEAREKLSLQVHPPAEVAARLGGEPKTEMWYIAHAAPGAELFVGLRRGVTRAEFERRVADGTVAGCFHRLDVKAGDAMFLPSGRVHAVGAGLVIFEIQQNSDTTYRVFDWGRVGLDGQPRELHVAQGLASIDFADYEPSLLQASDATRTDGSRWLVSDPVFTVVKQSLRPRTRMAFATHELAVIVGVLSGDVNIQAETGPVGLTPGRFCLLPAALAEFSAHTEAGAEFLVAWTGQVLPPS